MNNVGLFKRLVVLIYDGFLLVGVTMVGYGVLFLLISAFPSGFEASLAGKAIKVIFLLGISFSFYAWFWTHGGQTLGMKVWNLYLVNENGKFIGWGQSAVRYATAILSWGACAAALYFADVGRWYLAIGFGFTWSLVNSRNLAWHDILSRSQIVQVPRSASASKQPQRSD